MVVCDDILNKKEAYSCKQFSKYREVVVLHMGNYA